MKPASVADSMGVVADNHGASDHCPIWVVLVAAPAPH